MNSGNKFPSSVTNSAASANKVPNNLNGVANTGTLDHAKSQSSLGSTLPDIESSQETETKSEGLNKANSEDIKNETSNSADNDEGTSKTKESKDFSKKSNNKYEPNSTENLGPGKKIDENGNVVNTGTRKAVEAIGRGAAAYATKGDSIGKEDMITKNPIGDKAIGVVADTADKIPIAGKALNELGESGLADGVNDALDTVGNAKNGDIKGTAESAKKTVKDIKKVGEKYKVKIILLGFMALFPIFISVVVIGAICGPVLGGFMDVTSALGEFAEDVGDFFTGDNAITGTEGGENLEQIIGDVDQLIGEVPGFNSLDELHKSIVTAAAMGVSSGRPYQYGGKPTGPGLTGIPSSGLDCSGFVGWSIWTATNQKPSSLGTSEMIADIGGMYEEISASELQPGDIGLKHKNSGSNHTGIYAGNGTWFHAAGTNTGIVKSNYSGFTVYLRYKGTGAV